MLPFLKRIYSPKILFFTTWSEDPPALSWSAPGLQLMPEVLQARRRNSWLGCRKCSKQRGNGVMDQAMTSGDSSECTPASSGVQTISGRAGRSCGCRRLGKSSSRHGSPLELPFGWENWWGDRNGDEIRLKQRWQGGTRTGLVNKGRKGRKSTKTLRQGLRREWRIWNENMEVIRNRAMNLKGLSWLG